MRVGTYLIGIAAVLAMTGTLLAPGAALAKNPNPGILPVQSNAFGTTYAALALDWWKWALETPSAINPVLDTTGEFAHVNQSGKIWYLAGSFGGETTRVITVPSGKALFVPIVNYGGWAPTDGDTEEEIRATAKFFMDAVTQKACTIDGVEVEDLDRYRVLSDVGSLGPNDMTDVPEGSDLLLAEGWHLLLAPLSKGAHVIEFSATIAFDGTVVFWHHTTYLIMVEGR